MGDVLDIDVITAREPLKDARPIIVANLQGARIEPSRDDNGPTAGAGGCLPVIGICDEDIPAAIDRADTRDE